MAKQVDTVWGCWACPAFKWIKHDAGLEKLQIEDQLKPEGWVLVTIYQFGGYRMVAHCPECAEFHAKNGDAAMNGKANAFRKAHHDKMWSKKMVKAHPYIPVRWYGN